MRISDWSSDVCSSDLINENHAAAGLGAFLFMFWALWWPWVNFTWFASAYDNDDALYRCLVFVQMIGALVNAVGFRNYDGGTPTILSLDGYIIMRLRSDDRRVRKEYDSNCRYPWSQNHSNKN